MGCVIVFWSMLIGWVSLLSIGLVVLDRCMKNASLLRDVRIRQLHIKTMLCEAGLLQEDVADLLLEQEG